MAVNIANGLLPHVEESFLCCTRQEGILKDQIKTEVKYVFLNKKNSLDPIAIYRLSKFIKKNKIDIVHTHSTSFFLAGLLKLTGGKFKLIWHDHYGESEDLEAREFKILKKLSRYFSGIISVNTALKEWAVKNLNCKKVIEIKNFVPEFHPSSEPSVGLKGNKKDFRIICVANLRPQKGHFNLLKAFEMLDPDLNVSLHLIGEDPGTQYSASVLEALKDSPVKEKIFFYGIQTEIIPLLCQVKLGVLASRSEGLPLALIEYGMAGIPVVCTDVGLCAEVIGGKGKIVPPEDPSGLAANILNYLKNPEKAMQDGLSLQRRIEEKFSEKKLIADFVSFYLK